MRQRQVGLYEFKASLVYKSWFQDRLQSYRGNPVSKNKQMKIKNKNTKAALGEIVYCGSQLKVAGHRAVEVTEVTEEDFEEAGHIASSQEAETDKSWCYPLLSYSPGFQPRQSPSPS